MASSDAQLMSDTVNPAKHPMTSASGISMNSFSRIKVRTRITVFMVGTAGTSPFQPAIMVRKAVDLALRARTLNTVQSTSAGRWQTFRFVVLPSALPQIMTGLCVSMGTALTILVASELLGGDRGLGFVIPDASSFFPHDLCFRRHLIGLIGLVSDRGIAYLARWIVHWEGKVEPQALRRVGLHFVILGVSFHSYGNAL
jgi:hypothetical protein